MKLEKAVDGFYYFPRVNMPTERIMQGSCEKACSRLHVTMRLALLKTEANYLAAMNSLKALSSSEYFRICRVQKS